MKPEDKAVVQQALDAFTSSWSTEQEMFKVHDAHMKAIAALHQLLERTDPVRELLPQCTHDWVSNPKEKWCLCCGAQEPHQFASAGKATPPAQPDDHADELTIAYLDGVHTGKQIAKREWVGLTDEDILEALDLVGYDSMAFAHAYAIEAKLREKNGGGA